MLLTEPTARRTARSRSVGTREQILLAGIVTAIVVWLAWGALDPLPVIQDEKSYVLQSRIFATGRWTVPSPPMPEFFQEAHVLTIPRVASKFPPGHALLLALGTALGSPPFVPLLLSALTGALLFALVRRAVNAPVAVLTLIVWLGDPINLRYRPSYFSEVTTGLMWLGTLGSLWRWRETRARAWLLAVAACVGWGAITRPLTMLSFALPVGVFVLREVWRTRRWGDLAAAVVLGSAILSLLGVWSQRTTGDWKLWPITLYQRQYIPYDHPGFGLDSTPPTMELAVPQRSVYIGFREEHIKHTVARLPRTILDRLGAIASGEWPGSRMALIPFVLVGIVSMTGPIIFALVCSVALFAGYLSYGHWAAWTLYYFEALPILSVLAAIGIWRTAIWLSARTRAGTRDMAGPLIVAAFGLVGVQSAMQIAASRDGHQKLSALDRFIEETTSRPVPGIEIRGGKRIQRDWGYPDSAILFVRYANRLDPHASIVRDSPDLAHELWWIVHDRGPEEACKLIHIAPNRAALVLDEATMELDVYRDLSGPKCRAPILLPLGPAPEFRRDSTRR